MLIYTEDMNQRGVVRQGATTARRWKSVRWRSRQETSPQVRAALEERRKVDGLQWGAFVANEFGLFANVSVPLQRNRIRRGWVVAPVELQTLSRITRDLSTRFGTHAFILDGDDHVLAEQRLADPKAHEGGYRAVDVPWPISATRCLPATPCANRSQSSTERNT